MKPLPVELWVNDLKLAGKSKGHIRGMMHLLFNWAMRWELTPVERNPMSLVRVKGSSKRTKVPRILTIKEFNLLLARLTEPFRTEAGLLRIYDGKEYKQIKTVENLPDADSIGYDAATKYLYVTTASKGVGSEASALSVVDTTTAKHLGDIKLPAESPEAMAMETSGPRIFVDLMDQNKVAVIDRQKRQLVAVWPITKCKKVIAAGLDEAHHRLFVGCRDTETSGTLDVIDSQTGKELETYPLGGWVDYIAYDATTGRIYASCGAPVPDGGAVYVFQTTDQGHYRLVSKTPTAPRAKTALFVPEIKRLFVSVPHFEGDARILFYQVE